MPGQFFAKSARCLSSGKVVRGPGAPATPQGYLLNFHRFRRDHLFWLCCNSRYCQVKNLFRPLAHSRRKSPLSMASQPEIVHSCALEAAKGAQSALEHCVADAVTALQIAETQSMRMVERDQIAAAWRELQKKKSAWAAQYAVKLLEAFNAGIATTARAALLSRSDFVRVPIAAGAAARAAHAAPSSGWADG